MHFEKSNDTKILESLLSEAKIGDAVTYEQMSQAIGRDVRVFARSALATARRSLLRDKQYVFGVEVNQGFRRLNDSQVVDSTENDRRKQQRAAKRVLRKLSVVEFSRLDEKRKLLHVMRSAQFGAIAMFSSSHAAKRIESNVKDASKSLAIGETLKMFS